MTKTEATRDLFLAKPNVWISAFELERVGGRLAWRTECSRCHTRYGMRIEKKLVRGPSGEVRESFRRYVPTPPPAGQIALGFEATAGA